jgi:plasmid stabilization system protein ParE
MARLALSRLALRELAEIEKYSVSHWGKRVAAEYMAAIEQGLQRLRENPQLLKRKPEVSGCLEFYRVRQHFLVCALKGDHIFVLCVKHGAMDLPERIGELEPHLLREAEILHRAVNEEE